MRQRSWARNARTLAIGGSAVIGVAVAGLATTMSASAHYILGTTPLPTVGVVGTTPLADQALVYADSTRHVEFFLWAPGTCGVQGTSPVFTDSEPVTTASLTDSTVTSATFVPQSTGTFQWTAEIIVTATGAVESGPTTCGDEPVTVNKNSHQHRYHAVGRQGRARWDGNHRFGHRRGLQPDRKRAFLPLRTGQHDLQLRPDLGQRAARLDLHGRTDRA